MKVDHSTPNLETARLVGERPAAVRSVAAWSPALLALLLGVVALLPRVLGLADFITTDEAYHWVARTERFAGAIADHRWAATNLTGHPGVTLMWLGSLGLSLASVVLLLVLAITVHAVRNSPDRGIEFLRQRRTSRQARRAT